MPPSALPQSTDKCLLGFVDDRRAALSDRRERRRAGRRAAIVPDHQVAALPFMAALSELLRLEPVLPLVGNSG
jgi:hypothetical protein